MDPVRVEPESLSGNSVSRFPVKAQADRRDMRCHRYIVLFCCLTFVSRAQQRVPELHLAFQGNEQVPESELLAGLRAENLLTFRQDVDSRIGHAVLDLYRRNGYYFCEIDSVISSATADSSEITLTLHLAEGPLLRAGRVRLSGCVAVNAATLLAAYDVADGSIFSAQSIEAGVERILAVYDRSGYPFAAVIVDSLHVRLDDDETLMDVALLVREGDQCALAEISVEGNTQTNPEVIVREMRIGVDEPYNVDKINDIRRRVERLNFFSSVAEPELYVRSGRCGLLLRVVEGNTNTFDGVIGYQPPPTPGEDGYLTGLVRLSFRNIFGTGRRLDTRWERATRQVSEWELRYLEPWVFGLPLNLQGGFFQRQQDSAYVRRAFDARATYLATSSLQIAASIQTTQVIPASSATATGLQQSSTLLAGLELVIDTRDNIYHPRSGIHLRNSYAGGSKSFTDVNGPGGSQFVSHIEIDASYYQETFSRFIAAIALHGRELRSDRPDIADLYRLGGANTLRGYREEQFGGSRIAWINLEYRYSLGRKTFAFVFFDAGYVFLAADERIDQSEFTAYRNGYGVGARIETGLGVLGISYALGQGDTFTNGKIHFGLINEF